MLMWELWILGYTIFSLLCILCHILWEISYSHGYDKDGKRPFDKLYWWCNKHSGLCNPIIIIVYCTFCIWLFGIIYFGFKLGIWKLIGKLWIDFWFMEIDSSIVGNKIKKIIEVLME